MTEKKKSKNNVEENESDYSVCKIVCCAHGIRCDRASTLLKKECYAVPRKACDRPKGKQQNVLCQPKNSSEENKKRQKRSYFGEKHQFEAASLVNTSINTQMSATSLLLPAFSDLKVNSSTDVKNQAEGSRNQPYIANEKIHPQEFQEEVEEGENHDLYNGLLEKMYIGCKTEEEAEEAGNTPSNFVFYHRKHTCSDISQLLKPLPLYLLYTRSNGEFRHNVVRNLNMVENGVEVQIDAFMDDKASTPFSDISSVNSRSSSTSIANKRRSSSQSSSLKLPSWNL